MRGPNLHACRLAAALSGAVLLAGSLTGCDTTVQETLGLGKRAPDEFQVVRRAPLAVPPDYNLRPAGSGRRRWTPLSGRGGGEPDTSDEAREILTGSGGGEERREVTAALGAAASQGERALVQASPVRADPEVRSRIVTDSGELTRLDQRLFFMILDFQRGQFGRGDEVLDPAAEAARIRTRGQTGVVTVRTGSTPLPAP
jgi:hypothetical protein